VARRSAGILLFRWRAGAVEVLLAHPGGPFWSRKDAGAWSIPKGEHGPDEEPLSAARREFAEETGHPPPDGAAISLGEIVQPSRKVVTVFALEGEFDPAALSGETIEIDWPPRSGRRLVIPEIDRVEWFSLAEAERRILPGQRPFLARLETALSRGPESPRAAPRGASRARSPGSNG
jgi:predicted NUDIX family NTP pyrophosphohydrolase